MTVLQECVIEVFTVWGALGVWLIYWRLGKLV